MYVMLIHVGGNAVIKAQVLAGGRGKGHFESGLQGGVKLASRFDVNTTGVHHLLNTYMFCTCIKLLIVYCILCMYTVKHSYIHESLLSLSLSCPHPVLVMLRCMLNRC